MAKEWAFNRYECQFRDKGKEYFMTDCAFHAGQAEQAKNWVGYIYTSLAEVAEGRVLDRATDEIIYQIGGNE